MSLFDDIRDQNPGLTEQEILDKLDQIQEVNAAAPVVPEMPAVPAAPEMAPEVQDPKAAMYANLRQKYNLDQYSDDKRKALADDSVSASSNPVNAVLAGLSGLGAGIAGRDVSSGFKSAMDLATAGKRSALDTFDKNKAGLQKDYDFEKGQMADKQAGERSLRENDPNSQESKMAQDLAVSMGMNPDIAKGLTASKFQQLSPVMQKKYEIEQKKLDRQDAQSERRLQQGVKADEKMVGLTTPFGIANNEDDAKKLKDAASSKSNFDSKIDEMIALREKHHGGAILNREDVARGKQLSKDLLLEYKNMAKLGVLSKSDEDIINKIIPEDPLEYNSILSGISGQDPILHTLKKFKGDSDRDFNTQIGLRIRQDSSKGPRQDPGVRAGSTPKGSKVRVSNGSETLEIDESDLADAQKDGFKRI